MQSRTPLKTLNYLISVCQKNQGRKLDWKMNIKKYSVQQNLKRYKKIENGKIFAVRK